MAYKKLISRMGCEPVPPVGSGIPLLLFREQQYHIPNNLNIHGAVELGVGKKIRDEVLKVLTSTVTDHVTYTARVKDVAKKYGLSPDECGAIAYYTSDARTYGGNDDECLYRILNINLSKRNSRELEDWKPFLYYLLSALNKLPNFSGEVYRALNFGITKKSQQYSKGNRIVWVAFTSTSKKRDIIESFTGQNSGTWMSITITEGKDISAFSLFPDEEEILLLPNTTCNVEEILHEKMKIVVGLTTGIDALVLKQAPTPEYLRLMKERDSEYKINFEVEKKNPTEKDKGTNFRKKILHFFSRASSKKKDLNLEGTTQNPKSSSKAPANWVKKTRVRGDINNFGLFFIGVFFLGCIIFNMWGISNGISLFSGTNVFYIVATEMVVLLIIVFFVIYVCRGFKEVYI